MTENKPETVQNHFGSILATNSETIKRPPRMIYLNALGAYWNECSTYIALVPPAFNTMVKADFLYFEFEVSKKDQLNYVQG